MLIVNVLEQQSSLQKVAGRVGSFLTGRPSPEKAREAHLLAKKAVEHQPIILPNGRTSNVFSPSVSQAHREESEQFVDKISVDGKQASLMGGVGLLGAGLATLGGAPLPVAGLVGGGIGLSLGFMTAEPFSTINWKTALPAAVAGAALASLGSVAGPLGLVGAVAGGDLLGGVVAPSFGVNSFSY